MGFFSKNNQEKVIYNTDYVKTISEQTKSNTESVKALSENYVIQNAKKANKLIEDMENRMKRGKSDKRSTVYFISQLKEIVKFYEYITEPGRVKATVNDLLDYYRVTEKFYNDIDKVLENNEVELNLLRSDLKMLESDNTREIQLKRQSLNTQISFTEKIKQMLHEFKVCYQTLLPTLEKVTSDVNYFVLAITESAKVYKKAVEVAELSQAITNGIDTIQQLNELNNLSKQITESWQNLQSITDQLAEIQRSVAA